LVNIIGFETGQIAAPFKTIKPLYLRKKKREKRKMDRETDNREQTQINIKVIAQIFEISRFPESFRYD
jgi:hypothetical protein